MLNGTQGVNEIGRAWSAGRHLYPRCLKTPTGDNQAQGGNATGQDALDKIARVGGEHECCLLSL